MSGPFAHLIPHLMLESFTFIILRLPVFSKKLGPEDLNY